MQKIVKKHKTPANVAAAGVNFSIRLREWQEAERLTDNQAAARLGVRPRTYENWVQGHRKPNWFTIQQVLFLTRGYEPSPAPVEATSIICWHLASAPPADHRTVLVVLEDNETWLGRFREGEGWRYGELGRGPLMYDGDNPVTLWADLPGNPVAFKSE